MECCKKKGSIPFPELPKNWAAFRSPEGTENPAQAQRPGGVGKASELPHFLESSPVPCGPARSFIGGPGEPDNRRWLALKQSGNPLHFAGTAHRRERSSSGRDHSSEPHGPTCPTRIE